jgi:hypothetical protein
MSRRAHSSYESQRERFTLMPGSPRLGHRFVRRVLRNCETVSTILISPTGGPGRVAQHAR